MFQNDNSVQNDNFVVKLLCTLGKCLCFTNAYKKQVAYKMRYTTLIHYHVHLNNEDERRWIPTSKDLLRMLESPARPVCPLSLSFFQLYAFLNRIPTNIWYCHMTTQVRSTEVTLSYHHNTCYPHMWGQRWRSTWNRKKSPQMKITVCNLYTTYLIHLWQINCMVISNLERL